MRDYKETSAILRGLSVSLQAIDPDYAQLCDDAADAIEELQAQMPKRGHDTGKERIFSCSECGYGISDIFLADERNYPIDPNYCPNCGAKMKGVSEDA